MAALIGLNDFAKRLDLDDSIYAAEQFNATHTWTEYVNRLLGALSGILILLVAILSIKGGVHTTSKFWSLMALLAVVIVGFLGDFVVSTNLIPFLITIHFLLAFAVLLFLFLASK